MVGLRPPDLAIINLNMPHFSGIRTAPRLLDTYPNVKVIFLTLLNDSITVEKAVETGANGYPSAAAVTTIPVLR